MRFTRIYVSMFPKRFRIINRFIDPTARWNPFRKRDGSDWKHCYRSLTAWNAEACDLVAENASVVANCRGGADTKPVKIEGWDTSPENPLIVRNCVAYEGEKVLDSGKYRINSDSQFDLGENDEL